mgnify:CR=1 FL=1
MLHYMTIIAKNKSALFNYELLETHEAGLVLTGQETKSIKTGHISLKGAYVSIRGGELWLRGSFVPPYKMAGTLPYYDPMRDRKLLLRKKEIERLAGKLNEKGLTITPIKVYIGKRSRLKIEIALVRGKQKHDKRESIKKRAVERDIRRQMKRSA